MMDAHGGRDRAGTLLPPGTPPAFHLLAKPTGAICNLDCTYCFFLSKEMLYPGSRFRMADDLLELYLRQLIEAHAGSPEVVVAWQGGEPTMMGLDFFRRSVQLAEALKQPGQRIVHTIQTNGTLLDDAWAAFFAEHGFLVGLSIDGPLEVHDTYRVDKGGKGSLGRVMKGLATLQRNGVEWNALTTVHAANQDQGREIYLFLRDQCGARFMQFIPIVERATPEILHQANAGWGTRVRDRPLYTQDGSLVTGRSVSAGGYGRFLIDVFEEWVRHDVGQVYVQMFDVALANWYGEPPGLCVHSETCGLALALEHTGDLYSCDHFVEPAYKLGNIRDKTMIDLITSPQQAKFGLAKRDTLPGVLSPLRRALRLPRRMPEGPVRLHAGRRAGTALPVPELQGVLRSHPPGDGGDVRPAARRPGSLADHRSVRHSGRQARPQRVMSVRLGPEMEKCHGALGSHSVPEARIPGT